MRESFCKAKVESSLPRVETIERRQLLSVTPAAVTPVTNPFIDLTATIAISSPKNDRILPGSRAGVSIEVFNTGNVPAKGPATGTLDLVAQGFDLVIANIAPHLRVPAGKHQILHESAVIPTGISPGAYAIEVNLATGGFQGSTTSTASATSGTLTVLDPFPNLLGVWSGIDHVVRGPSKGAKPTIELDFTSESDTDGALIATGTLFAGVSTSRHHHPQRHLHRHWQLQHQHLHRNLQRKTGKKQTDRHGCQHRRQFRELQTGPRERRLTDAGESTDPDRPGWKTIRQDRRRTEREVTPIMTALTPL
jgi:hypothetical protein